MDTNLQEFKELLKQLTFGEIVSGLLTLRYEQYREIGRIIVEKGDQIEQIARFDAKMELQKENYVQEVKPEPEVHGDPKEEINYGVTPNTEQ